MFYDENGKHVRTKKEICTEDGQMREGCYIIPKGGGYEERLFDVKDKRFKSEGFLEEVKRSYTDLMNLYVKNGKEKLKVFERRGVYLATKKIGKNNPKAEQIEADNKHRQRWNEKVDVALFSGVPEQKILAVKKMEISDKVKENIQQKGHDPKQFSTLIIMAVSALQLIGRQVFDKYYDKGSMKREAEKKTVPEPKRIEVSEIPEQPKRSWLASKYPRLGKTYEKLN